MACLYRQKSDFIDDSGNHFMDDYIKCVHPCVCKRFKTSYVHVFAIQCENCPYFTETKQLDLF